MQSPSSFPAGLARSMCTSIFRASWGRPGTLSMKAGADTTQSILPTSPCPVPTAWTMPSSLLSTRFAMSLTTANPKRDCLSLPTWAALLPTERDRLAEAARRLGALEPLRASLAAGEIPCGAVDVRYPAELAHWNRGRKSGGQAGMVWLHRLASRPWHERPRIVLRAFWDISMDKAHTPQEWAAAGRRSRAHGRARRLRRGLGLIPQTSRRWRA